MAAEAIGTLAVLHAAGMLPRDDMEPVVSLLLDGEEQIRTAAAAVIPSLMTSNKDVTETDGAVGTNAPSVGGGAGCQHQYHNPC